MASEVKVIAHRVIGAKPLLIPIDFDLSWMWNIKMSNSYLTILWWLRSPVAYFTKEVNQGLGKPLWITMEICVNFSNLLSKINHWRSMYQSALWSSLDDVIKWRHFVQYWRFVRGIHRSPWLPTTKTNDAELWCFLWSVSEQTVELTIETLVIWDAIAPIMTSL